MTDHHLRVLVVHNKYRSAQPSGEDHVVEQEMSLLADAGHTVSSFERQSDAIATMSLLERVAVPLRVAWNTPVRAELAARLDKDRPDVVHVHNTFPLLSPSVVAACADAGVPAVATLHNYLQVCPSGTLFRNGQVCTDCAGRLPLPALRHGCYRKSRLATVPLAINIVANRRRWWSDVARFFCISDAQRKLLIQSGMPSNRLAVKHNFVPDSGIHRTGPGQHVLYLGRLSEEKGIRLLMAAWDELAAASEATPPLVIAGTGPLQEEVTRWARDRQDVQYLGLRSKAECRSLTARSVAVVAPSTWMEAFGLVVVEAMAAGVPAIAAAHGAFVELVDDKVTGLLHRPGDAVSLAECLRAMIHDIDRNLRFGRAARRSYLRGFTPAVGLERLIAGYEAAITGWIPLHAEARRQATLPS